MPYKNVGLIASSQNIAGITRILKQLHFCVAAVWCPDQDIGIQVAAECEVPFVASQPDEVLLRKEVEMVVVACSPHLHSQICDKAMGIGKHVLCTLPCALDVGETERIVQAAQYFPQLLAVGAFGLRKHETFVETRKLLLSDDWAQKVQGLVKTYANKCPPSKPLNGFRNLNSDDFCSFMLKMSDETCATINLNCVNTAIAPPNSNYSQTLTITGSLGSLSIVDDKLFITKISDGKERLIFDAKDCQNCEPPNCYPCHILDNGFVQTLKALACSKKSNGESCGPWRENIPELRDLAGFEDVQYVRNVIDAVRFSSVKGDWVRVGGKTG